MGPTHVQAVYSSPHPMQGTGLLDGQRVAGGDCTAACVDPSQGLPGSRSVTEPGRFEILTAQRVLRLCAGDDILTAAPQETGVAPSLWPCFPRSPAIAVTGEISAPLWLRSTVVFPRLSGDFLDPLLFHLWKKGETRRDPLLDTGGG